MKRRITTLITMGILSFSLICNSFTSLGADKPQKPNEIEGEVTNDKIKKYNAQVEKYNQEVDNYNLKVDEEYQSALKEVQGYNEQVEPHNEAERQKVSEIEQRNANAQTTYDAELEKYNKFLQIEEKVKKNNFESVEAYNDYINNLNIQNDATIEKNTNAADFDITKSYKIIEGASPASDEFNTDEPDEEEDTEVKVHIEHNFGETSYSTDFTIGIYDTIIFYSAALQMEQTQPGYVTFYINIGEEYTRGYWSQGSSTLMCTANINEDGWQCGDVHTVSYAEGKKHPSDSTDIDMIYDYNWNQLDVYQTIEIVTEPKLELEEYTPDFWEIKPEPEKEEYLEHLALKDLLPEPTPEPEPQPTDPEPEEQQKDDDKPKKKHKKKAETAPQESEVEIEKEEIEIREAPTAAPAIKPVEQSKPVAIVQQPIARQYQTGDNNNKIAIRLGLIGICLILAIGLLLDTITYKK